MVGGDAVMGESMKRKIDIKTEQREIDRIGLAIHKITDGEKRHRIIPALTTNLFYEIANHCGNREASEEIAEWVYNRIMKAIDETFPEEV